MSDVRQLVVASENTDAVQAIYVDGKLIGGVGVSGGTVEQDVSVATAAVLGLSGASYSLSS